MLFSPAMMSFYEYIVGLLHPFDCYKRITTKMVSILSIEIWNMSRRQVLVVQWYLACAFVYSVKRWWRDTPSDSRDIILAHTVGKVIRENNYNEPIGTHAPTLFLSPSLSLSLQIHRFIHLMHLRFDDFAQNPSHRYYFCYYYFNDDVVNRQRLKRFYWINSRSVKDPIVHV